MAVRVLSGTLQTVNEHNHTEYLVLEYLSLKRTKVMHIFLKMIETYHFKGILHYS